MIDHVNVIIFDTSDRKISYYINLYRYNVLLFLWLRHNFPLIKILFKKNTTNNNKRILNYYFMLYD